MQSIIVVSVCFLLGTFGAWLIIRFGKYMGVLDVPNERSSHDNVIPKGGGIGVLSAFVFCSLYLGGAKSFWISGLVLALVSFMGDRRDIRPRTRLVVQFGCGLVFLLGLMTVRHTHLVGYLLLVPLSVFIVWTANFYNFMDGINGIAGITGVVGFLLLAVYGHGAGSDSVYIVLSVAMASSCAGFLPFNIPRAKVFMGDVGSVLLGFVFACLVVLLSASFFDFICMTAFLFPFYADELTTMAIRIRDGDKLSQAHRKHVYQLLANEYGIDHWKVSLGYGVVQLVIGCVVFVIRNNDLASLLSFLAVCFFCFVLFSVGIRFKITKKGLL